MPQDDIFAKRHTMQKGREVVQSIEQKKRIEVLRFFIPFIVIALLGRLFYLQVINHDYYLKIAGNQQWAKDVIVAKRGVIYVEDSYTGELYPIAINEFKDMVYVSPEELEDPDDTVEKLISTLALEKSKEEILASFELSRLYVPIKHKLTDEEVGKIEELNIEGVHITEEQWRYYPENELASQILGYVNDDGYGQYGLEGFFDDILRGITGLYRAESDPTGTRIAFGKDVSKPAEDGDSVVLTINRDIQAEVEKLLKAQVEKFEAEGGSVIVMDPTNGDIVAMANSPAFDPNKYTEIEDFSVFKNRVVTDEYEPGSIFKVITMAAGLDLEKVEPDSTYEDTGSVVLDGHKIMNSDKKAYGEQTMTQVLEESLNTGVAHVLDLIGKEKFHEYILNFGFGEPTGIESDAEASGQVLPPTERDHTYATITFGQSINTTPIQIISSFAAIANDGVLIKPRLVKKIIRKDGSEEEVETVEVRRVISEKTSASLKAMLVSVVENGHATGAKVKGYKVAGKTGTAQVPLPGGAGYDPKKNIGSFIGFAPAIDPKYVVLVKIDAPKGTPWAASTAAPVVGDVLDKLMKYYQIPPTELDQIND